MWLDLEIICHLSRQALLSIGQYRKRCFRCEEEVRIIILRRTCTKKLHASSSFAIGCSFSEEYLLYVQDASSFPRLSFLLFLGSLPLVPFSTESSSSFCSYSRRGEAAPRTSRCFICLSVLFITCNLALARARVISYWFSAPLPFSPRAVASSSSPFSFHCSSSSLSSSSSSL